MNIKKLLLRYRFFLLFLLVNLVLLAVRPDIGILSFKLSRDNFLEMLSIVPPVFILLGLLDTWIERETMIKYMGSNSGVKGAVIAFIMGSAAAGPLYASFPVAGILLKKGAKLTNVFIFVGAWSTTKIPMLLFEASNLGVRYMVLRLFCNIIGIIVIALALEKTIPQNEKEAVYKRAETL